MINKKELNALPVLDDGQTYIYVLKNSAGNSKIGKTTNIAQRVQSLSASNSGGFEITDVWVSKSTYLSSIEKIAHDHFAYARMSGEWFNGIKVSFDEAVEYVKSLFASRDYERCNELRRKVIEEKKD